MNKGVKTRGKESFPIFGLAQDLENRTCLPTYEDMMRCYFFVQAELKGDGSKQPPESDVAKIVANKIQHIWNLASIPTVTHNRVVAMITAYHKKFRNLIKPLKNRNTPFLQSKIDIFKTQSKILFDICSCKCTDINVCICDKNKKVPLIERTFLCDQRTERKMRIGGVDKEITKKIQKRDERRSHERAGPSKSLAATSVDVTDLLEESSSSEDLSEDPEFKWSYSLDTVPAKIGPKKTGQLRIPLPNIARMADMTGASNRTVAKIETAALQDFGLVSSDNPINVIDKSKIRRELTKKRKAVQEIANHSEKSIQGIYFDGRKDQTMMLVQGRRITKQQEHISIIEEPGSTYFGHISINPPGTALNISKSIITYIKAKSIDLKCLTVVGCDGTNVNTGWKSGIIRLLEIHIGRPLHWFICLLHNNELPLRNLLYDLDGHTKGPYSFSGPIGSKLTACKSRLVVNFQKIDTILPQVDEIEVRHEGLCSDMVFDKDTIQRSIWFRTFVAIIE